MKAVRALCLAALVAGVSATPADTHAQSYGLNATETAAYMAGLRYDRQLLAGTMARSPHSVRLDGTGMYGNFDEMREINLFGSRSPLMMEMARVTPDGKYQRPRLLVGWQSDKMRYWMHSMGIEAERCYAPMLRTRTNRAAETGKISAAVLLSARCSWF